MHGTMNIKKQLCTCCYAGPPTAGSGPGEKDFTDPLARMDPLKIFTRNRKY